MVKVVTEKRYPPPAWLMDCDAPPLEGATFRDNLIFTLKLKSAVRQCNNDKAALRAWAKDEE